MFCRCANGFGGGENTQTCPVCLGFPGALPVAEPASRSSGRSSSGSRSAARSPPRAVFARKNYFYPDLPKGYQISQYDLPSCINGKVLVPTADGDHEIGIVRAHLEEDAAKTTHVGGRTGRIGGADYSLVDFNRGGTPLVEIVTGPDIHSSEEARRFLQLLRQTIVELGISDAEMEKGTLRVDANVSVRPAGSDELRTRCELKNMNSFRFVAQGIDAEVARQIALYEAGGEVVQETYDFDAATRDADRRAARRRRPTTTATSPSPTSSRSSRRAELVERLRAELPESPAARIRRIEAELDLDRAVVLVTGGLDGLWQATVAAGADRLAAANVIANRLAGVDGGAVDPAELAKLVEARERIPRAALDEALGKVAEPASRPTRTSRRRRSPTRPSSSRSSPGSSTRTPARSPPTAAARRVCSASSSAR